MSSRTWPATAAWARCASATTPGGSARTTSTARWCWPRRSCSSTAGWSTAATCAPSSGWSGWAGWRCAWPSSPMPACGNSAAARRCTPTPQPCAGPPATGWRISPPSWGWTIARATGTTRRWQLHARILAQSWNEKLGHFVDAFDGEHLDASLLLLADIGFIEAMDPRFVATVDADRRGAGPRRLPVPLHRAGRFRRAGNQLQHLHVLVHRGAGGHRPPGTGARDVRAACWRSATRWACCPKTSRRPTASTGATSRRPIRMVGLIQAAMRLSRRWEDAL